MRLKIVVDFLVRFGLDLRAANAIDRIGSDHATSPNFANVCADLLAPLIALTSYDRISPEAGSGPRSPRKHRFCEARLSSNYKEHNAHAGHDRDKSKPHLNWVGESPPFRALHHTRGDECATRSGICTSSRR